MVAPLSIKEFPALVEKARVMEKLKTEVEAQQRSQHKVGGPSGSTSRQDDRRKPYSRPPPPGSRRFHHSHISLSLISISPLSTTLTGLGVFSVEGPT